MEYPMRRAPFLPILLATLTLAACDNDDGGSPAPEPEPTPEPQRGDLIDGPPELRGSWSPDELLALLTIDELGQLISDAILTPECTIDVHQLEYQTVDPDGNLTPASGVLMVPNDSDEICQGPRPIVVYAHGTATDRAYNIADLEDPENAEGLLMAAAFAAEGYIVVAPNYVGYDSSTLDFHPYLNSDQQSKDMIDALTAARSALPTSNAANTTADERLFVTGYSQGGYVAMATHRALQETGGTVTASAPMSGPYALSAFGDALFQGQVTGGSTVNLTLLLSSYQQAYGNLWSDPAEVFEAQYLPDIVGLLPNTTSVGELKAQGALPDDALFDITPPDPAYATMTPATTPENLAIVFALGFGTEHLLTNAFRLAYLEDSLANPDGGFPTVTDGLPPADPQNAFRQALKTNDLRNWTPTSPMLLCAGNRDPAVLYLNTQLMQSYWASEPLVTTLDIDSDVGTDDPYAAQKEQFDFAKDLVELTGGDTEVLEKYHAGLVAPFCLSAVRSFFDGL
jgi:pimeloyl-ACP methyl ester carboxylesterase